MTFGSGACGCLGHGNYDDVSQVCSEKKNEFCFFITHFDSEALFVAHIFKHCCKIHSVYVKTMQLLFIVKY